MSADFLFCFCESSSQGIEGKDNLRFFQFYFDAHFFDRFGFISGFYGSDHRGLCKELSSSISFREFLWVFLGGFRRGGRQRHWFGRGFGIRSGYNPHRFFIDRNSLSFQEQVPGFILVIWSLSGSTDLSLRFVSDTLDLINKVRVDFCENVPHFWELVVGISSPDDFAHIRLIWEIIFYWISVIADQTADSELFFNHGLPVVIRFESAVGFPLGCQSQIRLIHVFFVVMRRVYYS